MPKYFFVSKFMKIKLLVDTLNDKIFQAEGSIKYHPLPSTFFLENWVETRQIKTFKYSNLVFPQLKSLHSLLQGGPVRTTRNGISNTYQNNGIFWSLITNISSEFWFSSNLDPKSQVEDPKIVKIDMTWKIKPYQNKGISHHWLRISQQISDPILIQTLSYFWGKNFDFELISRSN